MGFLYGFSGFARKPPALKVLLWAMPRRVASACAKRALRSATSRIVAEGFGSGGLLVGGL